MSKTTTAPKEVQKAEPKEVHYSEEDFREATRGLSQILKDEEAAQALADASELTGDE